MKIVKMLNNPFVSRVLLLLVITVAFMGYNFRVFTTKNSIEYVDPKSDLVELSLSNQVIEQHFYANEPVRTFELIVFPGPGFEPGEVELEASLSNVNSGEILGTSRQLYQMKNEAIRARFDFPDTINFETNRFSVRLTSLTPDQDLYVQVTEEGYKETLVINGQKSDDQRLVFKVSYADNLLLGFFSLTLILLVISLAMLIFSQIFAIKTHQLFVIIALVSGLAIAFINPSGQEPDVGDHILRSFDVSYGNITPIFRQTNDKNVQMPTNFSEFDDSVMNPGLNLGLAHTRHLQNTYFASGEAGVQDYRYKSKYSTMTYWPQGLGLYLGRVWQWNAYEMILLARILNLLAYVFLTQLAIRQLPILRNTLMVIALMPIAVFQASALSADSVLNGMSYLFVALIIRLAMKKQPIHYYELLPSILSLWIIVLAKPAYILLALLYLIIPLKQYTPKFAAILRIGYLVSGASVAAALLYGFVAGWLKWAENKPVYDTQLDYVMHNLGPTMQTFFHTLDVSLYQYLSWLNMLGWINYSLGMLILIVPLFLIIVGLSEPQPHSWQLWQRMVIWSVFALTFAGIIVGLYVFDIVNSVGATRMLGAQGRYFIPLFLLPFLALKRPVQFSHISALSPRLAGVCGLILTYTLFTLTRLIY